MKGCKNIKVPAGFFGFNGKPVKNIGNNRLQYSYNTDLIKLVADCTWDYFSCTNNYGAWPGNKACCDERFSQCCMQVMTWTPTTQRPSAGYGPAEIDIDIETDLDLPTLENPIDDIDLAGGQSVHRPGARSDLSQLCSQSSSGLVSHPEHCSQYISCQQGQGGEWLVNIQDCSPGTVWDDTQHRCDFRRNVPRCNTGKIFTIHMAVSNKRQYS